MTAAPGRASLFAEEVEQLPAEVIEGAFVRRPVAVHVVKHAPLRLRQASRVQQPVDEGARLLGTPEAEQRPDGQRGIPRPAIPIVPVEIAADPLWQRGGRRRHDCTGWCIDHQLECERAPNNGVAVGTIVTHVRSPVAPPRDRTVKRGAGPVSKRWKDRNSVVGKRQRRIQHLSRVSRARPRTCPSTAISDGRSVLSARRPRPVSMRTPSSPATPTSTYAYEGTFVPGLSFRSCRASPARNLTIPGGNAGCPHGSLLHWHRRRWRHEQQGRAAGRGLNEPSSGAARKILKSSFTKQRYGPQLPECLRRVTENCQTALEATRSAGRRLDPGV